MARNARAEQFVAAPPAEVLEVWTDVERWAAFVDGFARSLWVGSGWPTEGGELAWESTPGGRGRVDERVEAYEAPPPGPDVAPQSSAGRIVTRVSDDSLKGRQTAVFTPAEGGTQVELTLDYELGGGGALQRLTDLIFIRRALRDSLRRTLSRFAVEAGR